MENLEDKIYVRHISGINKIFYKKDPFFMVNINQSIPLLSKEEKINISIEGIKSYFHLLYIPPRRSIIENIYTLFPGDQISSDRLLENDYVSLFEKNDFKKYTENFGSVTSYEIYLKDALLRSKRGNKKTSLFLSGGKDSSTLAIGAKLAGIDIDCITLGFNKSSVDETEDARLVANALGLPFRELRFTDKEYCDLWPEFIRAMDQPMGDPAALPLFAAFKKLKDEYSVFWDGSGNDGYFGSVVSMDDKIGWYLNRYFPAIRLLPWRLIPEGISYKLDTYRRIFTRPRPEQFVNWNGWTSDEILQIFGSRPDFSELLIYRYYKELNSPESLKTLSSSYMWAPETVFRKTVDFAQHFGVEVAFPFLDEDFVQYHRSLPAEATMKGRVNKVILRKLIEKHLPPEIIHKKKAGFIFPREILLKNKDFNFLDYYIKNEYLDICGVKNSEPIHCAIKQYLNGNDKLEDRVWCIFVLCSWIKEVFVEINPYTK